MRDYALAAYQLSQDFSKTHSPEEVKAFQQLEGRYEINNALSWIKQLEGQQAADTYRGTEASLAQSYKQHEDQLQHQMKQDQGSGRSSIAGDAVLDPMGIFAGAEANREKDPELRRCLELGGTLGRVRRNGRYGRYGRHPDALRWKGRTPTPLHLSPASSSSGRITADHISLASPSATALQPYRTAAHSFPTTTTTRSESPVTLCSSFSPTSPNPS